MRLSTRDLVNVFATAALGLCLLPAKEAVPLACLQLSRYLLVWLQLRGPLTFELVCRMVALQCAFINHLDFQGLDWGMFKLPDTSAGVLIFWLIIAWIMQVRMKNGLLVWLFITYNTYCSLSSKHSHLTALILASLPAWFSLVLDYRQRVTYIKHVLSRELQYCTGPVQTPSLQGKAVASTSAQQALPESANLVEAARDHADVDQGTCEEADGERVEADGDCYDRPGCQGRIPMCSSELTGFRERMSPMQTQLDADCISLPILSSMEGVPSQFCAHSYLEEQEDSSLETVIAGHPGLVMLSVTESATSPDEDEPKAPLRAIIDLCKHEIQEMPNVVQIQLVVPNANPEDLGDEVLANLQQHFQEKLSEVVADTQVVAHSVRKGSIMITLDLIYLGETSNIDADETKEKTSNLLENLVKPEAWCQWLQLPWPKDGTEVLVQVGKENALALKWDADVNQWVSSRAVIPAVPVTQDRILLVQPQVLALSPELVAAASERPLSDQGTHSHESSSMMCSASIADSAASTGPIPHLSPTTRESKRGLNTIELDLTIPRSLVQQLRNNGSGPKLRARYMGNAVPVSLHGYPRSAEDCQDSVSSFSQTVLEMSDLVQEPHGRAPTSSTPRPMGTPSGTPRSSEERPKAHAGLKARTEDSDESGKCTVKLILNICHALKTGQQLSSGLLVLEVWEERMLIQSVPVLVLSPDQSEMATELMKFLTSPPPPKQDPAKWLKTTNSHISKLGLWLECTSNKNIIKSMRGESDLTGADADAGSQEMPKSSLPDLRRYMVTTGRWLLELSMIRGWILCFSEITDVLINQLHQPFREIAVNANSNGHTLLHLAALSGKSYMVAAVIRLAVKNNFKWSWNVQDKHGVTPMHIVATSCNSSNLAKSLLKHFEPACVAWRTCKGGLGVTPEDIAAQLGVMIQTGKKKKMLSVLRSSSARINSLPASRFHRLDNRNAAGKPKKDAPVMHRSSSQLLRSLSAASPSSALCRRAADSSKQRSNASPVVRSLDSSATYPPMREQPRLWSTTTSTKSNLAPHMAMAVSLRNLNGAKGVRSTHGVRMTSPSTSESSLRMASSSNLKQAASEEPGHTRPPQARKVESAKSNPDMPGQKAAQAAADVGQGSMTGAAPKYRPSEAERTSPGPASSANFQQCSSTGSDAGKNRPVPSSTSLKGMFKSLVKWGKTKKP